MKKMVFLLSLLVMATNLNAQITNPAPYCIATFDDMEGFPVDDAINSVSIGTLTNVTNAQYAAPHYVFYNNLAAPTLTKGSSYTLIVKFDVKGGCGYGVWIDYNQNNTFEANEKVAGSTSGNSLEITTNTTITQSVVIPATATTGNTRMRVRIVEDDTYNMDNNYVIAACNASTSATDVMDWGETEDYIVNISGSATTTPIVNTTSATAVGATTATLNGSVNANGGSSCAVSFEYGLTTAYGLTATASPSTITGSTATAVSASLSGILANMIFHYRVKVVSNSTTYYGNDMTFTTLSSGAAENENVNLFKIYPNPANSSITVNHQLGENITVKIVDVLGKIVLSSDQNQISISSINDGIYMIQLIKDGKIVEQHKLVKSSK
jgi:hypothetical protein